MAVIYDAKCIPSIEREHNAQAYAHYLQWSRNVRINTRNLAHSLHLTIITEQRDHH